MLQRENFSWKLQKIISHNVSSKCFLTILPHHPAFEVIEEVLWFNLVEVQVMSHFFYLVSVQSLRFPRCHESNLSD